MIRTFLACTLFALAACAGGAANQNPDPTPNANPVAKDDHAPLKGGTPVSAYHDRLAPLWHAPKGDKRVTDTCAAADDLIKRARDTSDAALVTASEDLKATCATPDRKDFEAKFSTVHDAFHAVMEKAAKHKGEGSHEHH
jgi:hypothetical protein